MNWLTQNRAILLPARLARVLEAQALVLILCSGALERPFDTLHP